MDKKLNNNHQIYTILEDSNINLKNEVVYMKTPKNIL